MKIELAEQNQVKITWPTYDANTEAQISERLNIVPGINGYGRRRFAHVIFVPLLMELFPKASYDYDALRVSDRLAQAFYNMCARFDLELTFDESGAVCAVGEGASPLIRQLISEREHALRPFVAEAMEKPKNSVSAPVSPSLPPVDDERLGPLFRGIQNAKKKAMEQEIRYPKGRRKKATHDRP